jgi:hypothetical protein
MSTFAHLNHAVWGEIAPELTPKDFNEPEQMDVDFLRLLSRMRRDRDCGVPFRVVSDARDPDGSVGSTQSAHKERPCKAVDLRVLTNAERFKVITTALKHGIVRIGVYPPTEHQRATFGKGSGSVHLDASAVNAQRVMWMSW